jgi:hypothetical protein
VKVIGKGKGRTYPQWMLEPTKGKITHMSALIRHISSHMSITVSVMILNLTLSIGKKVQASLTSKYSLMHVCKAQV